MPNNTAIVPGSLQAMSQSQGMSLAESFLSADAIVLFDSSGSMEDCDAVYKDREGRSVSTSRYDKALTELKKLQAEMPGKLAVVNFSDSVEFVPGGSPRLIGGTTDLAAGLRFVAPADGTVRFFVISDGQPDDAQEALDVIAGWESRIDAIYIGPEGGMGSSFLKRLARARGGTFADAKQAVKLESTVKTLMLEGK